MPRSRSSAVVKLEAAFDNLHRCIRRIRAGEYGSGEYAMSELSSTIDEFVERVYRVPDGEKELRRRSDLLLNLTENSSEHRDLISRTRQLLQKAYCKESKPPKIDALWLVLEFKTITLHSVVARRGMVGSLLTALPEAGHENLISVLSELYERYRQLQGECLGFHVDGCITLYQTHEVVKVAEYDPPAIKYATLLDAATNLDEILAAAESILVWVRGRRVKKTNRRVGRKQNPDEVIRDASVFEKWEEFIDLCNGKGKRATFEDFRDWAVEKFDDLPSDDLNDLKRFVKAHQKRRSRTGKKRETNSAE